GLITSVTLRKYTATMSQTVSMNNNQLYWLAKHLGHTRDVHLGSYRQMSTGIEKLHIAKLLLIQDLNRTQIFRGQDIDKLNIEDIVLNGVEAAEHSMSCVEDVEPSSKNQENTSVQMVDTYDDNCFEEKQVQNTTSKRVKWSNQENKELEKYRGKYLLEKRTPGYNTVQSIKQKNKILLRLSNDKIVKKISAMNHKKNVKK
ncbi:unnamed protein product, partial [Owenia fusiformis]